MNRFLAVTLLLLGGVALPARADVVDQSQLSDTIFMAGFGQTDLAQSFQQAAANISGASVKLRAGIGTGTGDITIALYDKLPNQAGVLLASGTAVGVSAGQFATVSWSPVVDIPNTTYYLVFTSTNSTLGLGGDINNPYPRGQVFANAGFGSFPNFDYTFQTFASTAAVPEPSVLTLMGLGLAGVGVVRLLRRRDRIATA